MARSKWKGPNPEGILFTQNEGFCKKKMLLRNSEIVQKLVGKTVEVYTGKSFSKINITDEMLGFRVGEFCSTRAKFAFKKKRRK